MENELLIAAAGSGKTTHLVREALECDNTVLITTFTEENEKEIRKKFVKLNNGVIPSNITIQTWFSFLLEHGAKPYQGTLTDGKINGLLLVNEKSGVKFKNAKGIPICYKEDEIDKHYFTKDYQIYSDKLSKFAVKCNGKSKGYLIERISSLFKYIFIDEVQDMAGYDLEFIKLLFNTDTVIKLAGDPRQVTYHTHFSDKYKKYKDGKIHDFILKECKKLKCNINTETLKGSWRNNQYICDFANSIFPEYEQCKTRSKDVTEHDGVFLLEEKDVEEYLKRYSPLQLRNNKGTKGVNYNYSVKNFGESKGSTVDRVLIYPTATITNWILHNKEITSFKSKCQLYVAVTRAKHSVAIVCKDGIKTDVLELYKSKKKD